MITIDPGSAVVWFRSSVVTGQMDRYGHMIQENLQYGDIGVLGGRPCETRPKCPPVRQHATSDRDIRPLGDATYDNGTNCERRRAPNSTRRRS